MMLTLFLFIVVINYATRLDGMGYPDVSADDRAVADLGAAAEDGGVGVDNAVVADVGVALRALDGIALLVELKALRAEGNALIYLDVVADGGGLADNDTRAVINEEILADCRACVDINAGLLVGVLCHNSRQIGYAEAVELVSYAVNRDGDEAGIGEDDLLGTPGGRVALVDRLNVLDEKRLDARHLREDRVGEALGVDDRALTAEGIGGGELSLDKQEKILEALVGSLAAMLGCVKVAGEHKRLQSRHYGDGVGAGWDHSLFSMEIGLGALLDRVEGGGDLVYSFITVVHF